jgi:hypothetical protein
MKGNAAAASGYTGRCPRWGVVAGVALTVLAFFPSGAPAQSPSEDKRPHIQSASPDTGRLEATGLVTLRRNRFQRPWLSGPLPAAMRHKLAAGYTLALQKLKEERGCRALFGQLGAVGSEVLAGVQYGDGSRGAPCAGGVRAYTCVGCRYVHLCTGFANLEVSGAALIVLHEALHAAGLPESPPYPGAPTAREINQMVTLGCRLH